MEEMEVRISVLRIKKSDNIQNNKFAHRKMSFPGKLILLGWQRQYFTILTSAYGVF